MILEQDPPKPEVNLKTERNLFVLLEYLLWDMSLIPKKWKPQNFEFTTKHLWALIGVIVLCLLTYALGILRIWLMFSGILVSYF